MIKIKLNFKQKILIPILTILIASSSVFTLYVNNNLTSTYKTNRELIFDRNQKITEQSIINIRNTLIQNRVIISESMEMLSEVTDEENQTLDELTKRIGNRIEDESQVKNIHLFDQSTGEIFSSQAPISPSQAQTITDKVFSEGNSNYYKEAVHCFDECSLFVLEKIKLFNKKNYTLIIGLEIHQMIDKLSKLTGSDFLLIRKNNEIEVEYATNFFETAHIFKEIKEKNKKIFKEKGIINKNKKTWEYNLIPTAYENFQFIILNNISKEITKLSKSKQNSFIILAFIYVSLFSLLFYLLITPLNRLRLIGKSIPLLGSGDFEQLRNRLGKPGSDVDELGLIHQTAYDVSIRLQENARALSEALAHKSEQYAFLTNLLNHTQVIIIIYDHSFKITMINNFAEQYINRPVQQAIGASIPDIFSEETGKKLKLDLEKLTLGSQHSEYEHNWNGQRYWISWIHCDAPGELYLSIGIDVTDRHLAEQRMKNLAEIDALTGIYNRRTFTYLLNKAIREGNPLVLFYLDLDKFKQINDRLGHQKGDEYLKAVSTTIAQHSGTTATFGRLGGDEFAIFTPISTFQPAFKLASGIVEKVNMIQRSHFNIGIHASVSIGIAFYPKHAEEASLLMSRADLAMYRAKNTPSQNVCIYSPDINNYIFTKFDKRNFLSNLIADNAISLYLQPVINKTSGHVFYYECLARENQKTTNDNNKNSIFKYADECGFSCELDLHIIKMSFALLKSELVKFSGNRIIRLGINLSAQSIALPDFGNQLHQAISDYKIDYCHLVFEITETSEILNLGQAYEFINTLRKKGALVALDDFGDGFATLRYLRNLPFDIVKIDGQFVMNIDQSQKDQIIVGSLINTAKQFGLDIVIECVETRSVETYFKNLNVDYVQGYYYTPPRPWQEVIQTLALQTTEPP